jgi:hypothetical protein
MLCFEVYRNGEKLCTAGVGDFGVLSAILNWVSHHPEKLARWAAEGIPEVPPTHLEFTVGGHGSEDSDSADYLRWVEADLAAGDEILIRVVEAPSSDPPSRRYRDDPVWVEEQKKEYVRKAAKELGWEIAGGPDVGLESAGV